MKKAAQDFWAVEEDLEKFASDHRGWTFKEDKTEDKPSYRLLAQRTFEYPGGAAALLWIEAEATAGSFRPHRLASHISLPASGGPEESFLPGIGKRDKALSSVVDWATVKEQVLQVPLRAAEMKTEAIALEVVGRLKVADLYTLSRIFDVDFQGVSNRTVANHIVKKVRHGKRSL